MSEFAITSCEGKAQMNHERAEKVAKRMRRDGYGKMRAYRCRSCGWWHVGTSGGLK